MKRSCTIIILITLFFTFALMAQAQNVTQSFGENQSVNWTNQVVRATGIGAPNPNLPMAAQRATAIKAAQYDAVRNLVETIKGMYITSETTVRNAMVENDVIRTQVEAHVKNFKQVEGPRYMSDGSVEVVVEMPITGAISDALLPSEFGGGYFITAGQMVCPTCGQPWPQGKPVPPGVNLRQVGGTTMPAASSSVYTGLIIDCKGLGVRPAMAPKIVDEQGNEIYGSKFVSRDWAVEIGMVGYDKDLNRARQNDRVTNNPLVLKGVQASGPNKTDVVISLADAALVHQAAANQNFLDKCKVMFIVN